MRIFKTAWFTRFAHKERMNDVKLKTVALEVEAGRVEADLGGGVFKKRVAREGGGKSGGYRLLLCFRKGDRLLFMFAFAKSDQANIDPGDLKDYKDFAQFFFKATEPEVARLLKIGELVEIGD